MRERLKNETYLGKKLFFNFLGANFVSPKSGHQCEKTACIRARFLKSLSMSGIQYIYCWKLQEVPVSGMLFLFGTTRQCLLTLKLPNPKYLRIDVN